MSKIAVVFWSGTGNTETMANAVAEGAAAKGAEVETVQAADFSAAMAPDFDAIAFMEANGLGTETVHSVSEDSSIIALVESGLGVSIMPELLLRGRTANVRVLELENRPTRTIALAVPEISAEAPCVSRFADYVQMWVTQWQEAPFGRYKNPERKIDVF